MAKLQLVYYVSQCLHSTMSDHVMKHTRVRTFPRVRVVGDWKSTRVSANHNAS